MSTPTTTFVYRKNKDGRWVVYGPWSLFQQALRTQPGDGPITVTVTRQDGSTVRQKVRSIGQPFHVDGVRMAYGYMPRAPKKKKRKAR